MWCSEMLLSKTTRAMGPNMLRAPDPGTTHLAVPGMLLDTRDTDASAGICHQDFTEQVPALERHRHIWRELVFNLRSRQPVKQGPGLPFAA